jgi:predicted RNA-binding protein with PUA-like domain
MKYWLLKSEPEAFSIQDLAKAPKQTAGWDGVRNYQARNFLKEMRAGDRVLFYHSSVDPPAAVGTAVIAREAYPDATAWDRRGDHFDAKASPDNPIWQMVDIKLEGIFPRAIPLEELRGVTALADMVLLRKGSRLSVQPVTEAEFDTIVKLGHAPGSAPTTAAKKTAAKKTAAKKPTGKKPTAKKPANRTKGK